MIQYRAQRGAVIAWRQSEEVADTGSGTAVPRRGWVLITRGRGRSQISYRRPGAASADVTVALTGQALTASAGSLLNSRSIAAAGQAATVSAGALSPTRAIALSGIVANASAGTVTPSMARGLSGEAVSGLAGTIVYSADGNVTLALSGQAVTVSAGTLAASSAKALSGAAATVSAGSVSAARAAALAGVAVAASAGTVVPSRVVALSGQASTVAAGTIQYLGDGDVIVALTGQAVTTYAGTLSIEPSYTTAGVLYVPIRMVSGLWSASGVGGGGGEVAWLPPARQPMIYTDSRGQMLCDPSWYRFFEYIAEQRLAGKTGPTLTAVVQTVTDTQATSAAASAALTELEQKTSANAEALFVVREVVKGNSLTGANQIPQVEL